MIHTLLRSSLYYEFHWSGSDKRGISGSKLPDINKVRSEFAVSGFKSDNVTQSGLGSENLISQTNLAVPDRIYHKGFVANSSSNNDRRGGHGLLIDVSDDWCCKEHYRQGNRYVKQHQHNNLLLAFLDFLLRLGVRLAGCQLLWRISHDDCPSFCTRSIIARFSAFE